MEVENLGGIVLALALADGREKQIVLSPETYVGNDRRPSLHPRRCGGKGFASATVIGSVPFFYLHHLPSRLTALIHGRDLRLFSCRPKVESTRYWGGRVLHNFPPNGVGGMRFRARR